MILKKIIFSFGICFIFILGLVSAQECGNFICEEGEEETCPEDCFAVPESGICGDGICEFDEPTHCPQDCPDISEEEYFLENFGSEYFQQQKEVSNEDLNSEQTDFSSEQYNLPSNNLSSFLNNLFENPFILIGGGVFVFLILFLIVFLILRKKKNPESQVDVSPSLNVVDNPQ